MLLLDTVASAGGCRKSFITELWAVACLALMKFGITMARTPNTHSAIRIFILFDIAQSHAGQSWFDPKD